MVNNAYMIYILDQAAWIADKLRKPEDAAAFRQRAQAMREAVHARYFDQGGGFYVQKEQAYFATALLACVPPDAATRKRALDDLEHNILVTRKGHNWSGIIGTYTLFKLLEQEGRDELIHTMLTRTEYPSYGYMLEQGATAIWEFWDGTASRIHTCFTLVPWFVDSLAGIKPDPKHPGYKHFAIDPAIVGDVTWVKCAYDSVRGKIVSNWKIADGKLTMEVTVPANTTATIHVPTPDPASVMEGGQPAAKAAGVHKVKPGDGEALLDVGSGSYVFTAKAPAPRVAIPQATTSATKE
jgi:alpha-L-rhamnosidase